MGMIEQSRALAKEVGELRFGPPVAVTYNPLDYAWAPHELYLQRYGQGTRRFVWLGMNPGPFGMGQTGVPFGDVPSVRDWLGIVGPVRVPAITHPKRPVVGFELTRREGSGKRLWGWAADRFGTADAFFAEHFIYNYCPLFWVHETGRNLVPEKLRKAEREQVAAVCDRALRATLDTLRPEKVIAVGTFAEKCVKRVAPEQDVVRILHPSPASPAANRGWAQAVEPVLWSAGVRWPNG